jgi:hypothetical protein
VTAARPQSRHPRTAQTQTQQHLQIHLRHLLQLHLCCPLLLLLLLCRRLL